MKVVPIATIVQLLLLIAACTTTVSGGLLQSVFGKGNDGSNGSSNNKEDDSLDIWDYILEKITGGSYNKKTIFEKDVDDAEIVSAYKDLVDGHLETAATKLPVAMSERTMKQIIREDRRFLLYNSRRLSGECLPICEEPPPTLFPTPNPTVSPTTSPTVRQTGVPTKTPTVSPTVSPTKSPTVAPTKAPTKNPTGAPTLNPTGTPTRSPTTHPSANPTVAPTKDPTRSPTNPPTNAPTTGTPTNPPTNAPTTGTPTNPPTTGTPTRGNNNGIICEDLTQNNNLGYPFSSSMHDTALGATSHWEGCFPDVHSQGTGQSGFDDAIAVFIGGSYTGILGAEIEGNMVVLGDFDILSRGPLNVVSAGLGSQITPHPFGDCVKVGGTMSTAKRLEVYFLPPGVGSGVSYQCAMVAKGEVSGSNHFPSWMTNVNGFDYKRDASMDMSLYEEQKENLIRKSEYWSTFPRTPGAGSSLNGSVYTFFCSAEDVIQVFNIGQGNLHGSHMSYLFDRYCYGKTILINVRGTGDYTVDAKRMDWTDASGVEHVGGHGADQPSYGFDSCMNSNILWNFFEAGTVSMVGNVEWQGSILVNGNFNFMTIGQSGRTMIVGDVVQDKSGSELHNFQFNPPKPLPSPECDDFVPSNPTSPPTRTPTASGSEYECVLPDFLHRWTGIVKNNYSSAAHTIAQPLAVEGTFGNPYDPGITISPSGHIYMGERGAGNFNFNGGRTFINSLSDVHPNGSSEGIDYAYYEWLARNIKSGNYAGNRRVVVFTDGRSGSGNNGCYTLSDVNPAESAQPNGPESLAVFNTNDDICLENNRGNSRQWGPSVLAPFSKVILRSAYIDGFFISKDFECRSSSIQTHGKGYDGPIECIDDDSSNVPGANNPVPNPVSNPVSPAPTPDPTRTPTRTPTGGGGSDGQNGVPEGCVKLGDENNGTNDAQCSQCARGDPGVWHPCNAQPPRCHGLDCENSPNWRGPRYRQPTESPAGSGSCSKAPGTPSNNGVTDEMCATCASGDPSIWYPCNSRGKCAGEGCSNSPNWAG